MAMTTDDYYMRKMMDMERIMAIMEESLADARRTDFKLRKELDKLRDGMIDVKDLLSFLAALRLEGANKIQKMVILNFLVDKGSKA